MRFFSQFFKGISSYKAALQFTRTHQLWSYYVFPALLNMLIFIGIGALGFFYAHQLADYLLEMVNLEDNTSFLAKTASFFMQTVIYLAVGLLYFKSYKYMMLILLAPILSMLSEKVQSILHPEKVQTRPFQLSVFLNELLRSLKANLYNLMLEISITVFLLILSLFLGPLAFVVTPVLLAVEWYFLGFASLDLRNEFHQFTPKTSRKFVWKHKGLAIGNGCAFYLMLFVPFLGVLVAPMLATIAAGLSIDKK